MRYNLLISILILNFIEQVLNQSVDCKSSCTKSQCNKFIRQFQPVDSTGQYGYCCDPSCSGCVGNTQNDCQLCNTEIGYHLYNTQTIRVCCLSECDTCSSPLPNNCVYCKDGIKYSDQGYCKDSCPVNRLTYDNVTEPAKQCLNCTAKGTSVLKNITSQIGKQVIVTETCVKKQIINVVFSEFEKFFRYDITFDYNWVQFLNATFVTVIQTTLNGFNLTDPSIGASVLITNLTQTHYRIELIYNMSYRIPNNSTLDIKFTVPANLTALFPEIVITQSEQTYILGSYVKCETMKYYDALTDQCQDKQMYNMSLEMLDIGIYLYSFYTPSQFALWTLAQAQLQTLNNGQLSDYRRLKKLQQIVSYNQFDSSSVALINNQMFAYQQLVQNQMQDDLSHVTGYTGSFFSTITLYSLETKSEKLNNLNGQILNFTYVNGTNSILIYFNFTDNVLNQPYLINSFDLNKTIIRSEFRRYYFSSQVIQAQMQDYISLSVDKLLSIEAQRIALNVCVYINAIASMLLLVLSKGKHSHAWKALIYIEIINMSKYFNVKFPPTAKNILTQLVQLPRIIIQDNLFTYDDTSEYLLPSNFRSYNVSPYFLNNYADQAITLLCSLFIAAIFILFNFYLTFGQQKSTAVQYYKQLFYIYVWNAVVTYWLAMLAQGLVMTFLQFEFHLSSLPNGVWNLVSAIFWCIFTLLFFCLPFFVIKKFRQLKLELNQLGFTENKVTGKFLKQQVVNNQLVENAATSLNYSRRKNDSEFQIKLQNDAKIDLHTYLLKSFGIMFLDMKETSILTHFFIYFELARLFFKALLLTILSNHPVLQASFYAFITLVYLVFFITIRPFKQKQYFLICLSCEICLLLVEFSGLLIGFFDNRGLNDNVDQRLSIGTIMIISSIVCLCIAATYSLLLSFQLAAKLLNNIKGSFNKSLKQKQEEAFMGRQHETYDVHKLNKIQKDKEDRQRQLIAQSPKKGGLKNQLNINNVLNLSEHLSNQVINSDVNENSINNSAGGVRISRSNSIKKKFKPPIQLQGIGKSNLMQNRLISANANKNQAAIDNELQNEESLHRQQSDGESMAKSEPVESPKEKRKAELQQTAAWIKSRQNLWKQTGLEVVANMDQEDSDKKDSNQMLDELDMDSEEEEKKKKASVELDADGNDIYGGKQTK